MWASSHEYADYLKRACAWQSSRLGTAQGSMPAVPSNLRGGPSIAYHSLPHHSGALPPPAFVSPYQAPPPTGQIFARGSSQMQYAGSSYSESYGEPSHEVLNGTYAEDGTAYESISSASTITSPFQNGNNDGLELRDIPQSPYAARTQKAIERKRVLFVCHNQNTPGIALETVLRADLRTLVNAEDRGILFGFGDKVSYRIEWAGYPSFSSQQNCTRTKRGQVSYITLAEIVRQVARVTQKFFDHNSRVEPTHGNWRVGPGFISESDIILLGVDIVSRGSVQPIYQLRQRAPARGQVGV